MLSRLACASLLLGGAIISACSDASTGPSVDTTPKVVNQTSNACTNPLTLNAGQVIAGVTGTSICVSGGASGAEYALIPYYGSTQSSLSTTLDFTAAGTASPSASPSLVPSGAASFDVSAASLSKGAYHESHEFETRLRERERVSLRPFISAARAARRSSCGSRRADEGPERNALTIAQRRLEFMRLVICAARQ